MGSRQFHGRKCACGGNNPSVTDVVRIDNKQDGTLIYQTNSDN